MEAEAENVKTGTGYTTWYLSLGSLPEVLVYVRLGLVSLTMINAVANSSNNDT